MESCVARDQSVYSPFATRDWDEVSWVSSGTAHGRVGGSGGRVGGPKPMMGIRRTRESDFLQWDRFRGIARFPLALAEGRACLKSGCTGAGGKASFLRRKSCR